MFKVCPLCKDDLENLGEPTTPEEEEPNPDPKTIFEYYGCRYKHRHKFWFIKTFTKMVKYFKLRHNDIQYYITIDCKNKVSTLDISNCAGKLSSYKFDEVINMNGSEKEMIDRFEKYHMLA